MNYKKIYDTLIAKRQHEPVIGYSEKHHILPKGMYPEYKNLKLHPWNCVRLSAREHFIAHLLLAKIYKGRLIFAVWRMVNDKVTGRKINNRKYEIARKKLAEYNSSDEKKLKLSVALKGRIFTEEHKQNISISKKQQGLKVSEETKRKISKAGIGRKHTSESKQKMSNALKGKKFTEEHKQNISKAAKGKIISEETKRKISKATKGVSKTYTDVTLTCPHCNKTGGFGMLRWHFNNCRSRIENE